MPVKFWSVVKGIFITTVVFFAIYCVGGVFIEQFTDIEPWKFYVAVGVPYTLIIGWHFWAIYRGMIRDGNWWFEDDYPRRRRRRRW